MKMMFFEFDEGFFKVGSMQDFGTKKTIFFKTLLDQVNGIGVLINKKH